MTPTSALILLKVLLIVALGAAFVWWQLHALARDKKRTDELEKQSTPPEK
jgi:Flp pilus assembly protein TadB